MDNLVVNQLDDEKDRDEDDQWKDVNFQETDDPAPEYDPFEGYSRSLTIGQSLYSGSQNNDNEENKRDIPFNTTVTNPEKQGEGMSQYISYTLKTEYIGSDGQPATATVVRRFSDFSWLYQKLYVSFKGILIPPLPQKGRLMNRFGEQFIEDRRRGLEQFLNRIAAHKGLAQSEEVSLFLHGNESELNEAKLLSGLNSTFDSTAFVTFFKESVQSISSSFSGKEYEKTENDQTCENINNYIAELDTALTSTHTECEKLFKKEKSLAKVWAGSAVASEKMGQCESEVSEIGPMFTQLGVAENQVSGLLIKKSDQEVRSFQEPIKDYIRIVGSVKAMMKQRTTAHMTYRNSQSNIEEKQAKLRSFQGVAGKEDKVLAIEKSLIEAQSALDRDKEEMEKITTSCILEFERFKKSKRMNMRNIILEFCKIQIDTVKKEQEMWKSVLVTIDKPPR